MNFVNKFVCELQTRYLFSKIYFLVAPIIINKFMEIEEEIE